MKANKDHKLKHIFGPVASRRLGISLGIDLIPYKTCSFDCIYCESGKTSRKTIERKDYISSENIIDELKLYLNKSSVTPDYITLGGSGEPALNSQIGDIIKEIKNLTSIPIAILTNGSLLFMDQVKESLLKADLILPSLDAATKEIFQSVNRPHSSLNIKEIVRGLIDFKKIFFGKIWLEILFCQGINDSINEVEKIRDAIDRINPDKIHLNTVARPPADVSARSVSEEQLKIIKELLGEKAEIVTEFSPVIVSKPQPEDENRILNLLKRRPCTLKGISQALGIHQNELAKGMDKLKKEGKVQYQIYNQQGFYQIQ